MCVGSHSQHPKTTLGDVTTGLLTSERLTHRPRLTVVPSSAQTALWGPHTSAWRPLGIAHPPGQSPAPPARPLCSPRSQGELRPPGALSLPSCLTTTAETCWPFFQKPPLSPCFSLSSRHDCGLDHGCVPWVTAPPSSLEPLLEGGHGASAPLKCPRERASVTAPA